MNFGVEEWLQKIVAVKHESGISRLLQQLRWSAEIESFLRRLETNLRALVSSHHINTAYNCQLVNVKKFHNRIPKVRLYIEQTRNRNT